MTLRLLRRICGPALAPAIAQVCETGQSPRAFLTYMFASHAAAVLVDIETGETRVVRIVAAHDVGKAINPREVEGQIVTPRSAPS